MPEQRTPEPDLSEIRDQLDRAIAAAQPHAGGRIRALLDSLAFELARMAIFDRATRRLAVRFEETHAPTTDSAILPSEPETP